MCNPYKDWDQKIMTFSTLKPILILGSHWVSRKGRDCATLWSVVIGQVHVGKPPGGATPIDAEEVLCKPSLVLLFQYSLMIVGFSPQQRI